MKTLLLAGLLYVSNPQEPKEILYNQILFLVKTERITIEEAQKLWMENKDKNDRV